MFYFKYDACNINYTLLDHMPLCNCVATCNVVQVNIMFANISVTVFFQEITLCH